MYIDHPSKTNQLLCDDGLRDNREAVVSQGIISQSIQWIPHSGENFFPKYSFPECFFWFTSFVLKRQANNS